MWHLVPEVVLEDIFQYLDWDDRRQCARVCWHWYDVFHAPMLWRRLVVKEASFTELKGDIYQGYRDVISLDKVRLCFQNIGECLEQIIILKSSNYYNTVRFIQIMIKYIELSDYYPFPKLKHFEFTFACENYTPWHIIQGTGGQVLRELQTLLGAFQGIKHLKFNELLLSSYDAQGVVEHLLNYNRQSLEKLELVNFTTGRYAMFSLQQFHNIHTLMIAPQNLTCDTATMFANNIKGLRRLVIVQDKYTPMVDLEAVSMAAWWNIKEINPKLRVRLLLRGHVAADVDVLTQINAPVDEIVYNTPYTRIDPNKGLELADEYRLYLKRFIQYRLPTRFGSRSKANRIDASLLYMARECCCLETLIIRDRISTSTLLQVVHAARNSLKNLVVRRNAVLLKSDWKRSMDMEKDFYYWLISTAKDYDKTEREVGKFLGKPWRMTSDADFIALSKKAAKENVC